jgi:hypothetical protein
LLSASATTARDTILLVPGGCESPMTVQREESILRIMVERCEKFNSCLRQLSSLRRECRAISIAA